MNILVIGLGVIGTVYGYVFKKARHNVEHLIRDSKKASIPDNIDVKILDGRFNDKGEEKTDRYEISVAQDNSSYDFILVSVSSGKLEDVIKSLEEKNIKGTLILFNGIWEDKSQIKSMLKGWKYILGYPVAGGSITSKEIDCCIFDHVMLEKKENTNIDNYDKLIELLNSSSIKAETPFDMLEWIWIHMAINAAVISTAGRYGNLEDAKQAAENLMASSKILARAVVAIRETVKISERRNIDLKNYSDELRPYKIPARIAGIFMKRMFKNNKLTRRIMMLHNNMDDLMYLCKNVYDLGKNEGVEAPTFYENYEEVKKTRYQ